MVTGDCPFLPVLIPTAHTHPPLTLLLPAFLTRQRSQWFSERDPRPAASASPGRPLAKQILGPHPRPTKSETPRSAFDEKNGSTLLKL